MENFFSNLFFTILVLVTVVPALLVVLTLNIVRAACWLLLSLSGAAGLFFFLGADFVGATQLLIYVGGTLVLVIFGVMLTATGPFVRLSAKSGDWVLSILAAAALFALVAYGIVAGPWNDSRLFPRAQFEKNSRVGTFVSASGNEFTVKYNNKEQTHTLNVGARVLGLDRKECGLADLKSGQLVRVTPKQSEPQVVIRVEASTQEMPTTNQIGVALLMGGEKPAAPKSGSALAPTEQFVSGYLLPFEIVSVHLVVVLIGAAYLARAKRRKSEGA